MGSGSFLIVIPFLFAAVLSLILSAAAWRRVRSPGSLSFALAMLSVAAWLFAAAMESTTQVEAEIVTWAKVAYLGIVWLAPLWLLFVMEYIYPAGRYATRYGAALLVIPLITVGLVMSNEAHGLIWPDVAWAADGSRLVFAHGPWFFVFTGYSYVLLAASMVMLLRALLRAPRSRRPLLAGLIVGLALPWLGNIIYLSGLLGESNRDLTPFGLALSGLLIGWVLFRRGLFQHTPLAYETIIETIRDGFLLFDRQGHLIEVNAAAKRMLGLEEDLQVGLPAARALNGWPDLLRLLRMEHTEQCEIVGGAVELEASVCAWNDGDHLSGKLIVLHDITRRRQAEEELRTSERLYRQLVDAAPVGILRLDREGRVTFASPMVYEQYHIARGTDLVGRSPVDLIHPEDRAAAAARIRATLQGENHGHAHVYRLMRDDGGIFWGETVSSPIVAENGQTLGMLSITQDISTRKALENRLQSNLARQTFVNELLQMLFRAHDLRAALGAALEHTGLYFQASRVCLCQNLPDGVESAIQVDWSSPAAPASAQGDPLARFAEMPSWRERIELQPGLVTRFTTPDGREVSAAAFPIYGSEERLYGFLTVDHWGRPFAWESDDRSLMTVIGQILSGAVARIQSEQAEQRQRALAESLHDSAAALTSTLNLQEVLDRILSNLEKVVPGVSASIAMMDENSELRFVRWRGYAPDADALMRTQRLKLSDRRTYALMAETGEPIMIRDTHADSRWVIDSPALAWIRSFAGAPVRLKGKVVGFINLDSPETGFFPEDLSYSLRVFADQAALAIENARLYDAAHHRADEMSILYRIGLTLTAGLETGQVLDSLFVECSQVLPIDVFSVAFYDASSGTIDMPLYYKENVPQNVPARSIHTEPGLTGAVINQRRTLYLTDTTDPEIEKTYGIQRVGGRPTRSYVGVPLILLDQVVGVIAMQSYQPHAYAPEQVRLLETIATQAAIAVQNTRLYDQMRQMAITDSVTGLCTRRHFTNLGRSEVKRALRYNRQCSVLMVDLDLFKRVNDTYGHTTGDVVLQMVAEVCRKALRATDIVGRWGGEEFAIVLPEADRDGAALIAERIRRMMAERDIPIGEDTIRVTVSIGVATLSEQYRTLEALVDCADRAMYQAKQAGRNRVMVIAERT